MEIKDLFSHKIHSSGDDWPDSALRAIHEAGSTIRKQRWSRKQFEPLSDKDQYENALIHNIPVE